MTKAYWISRIDVHDPETYKSYIATARPAFERHKANFLARGGRLESFGAAAPGRVVVIEFESMEEARACYLSPEYQQALVFRRQASTGDTLLVEGV